MYSKEPVMRNIISWNAKFYGQISLEKYTVYFSFIPEN